jgi:hypothetical protein
LAFSNTYTSLFCELDTLCDFARQRIPLYMAEADQSNASSSSQSDDDCPPESARTTLTVDVSLRGHDLDSKTIETSLKNRFSIRKVALPKSKDDNADVNRKHPWGWGSPRGKTLSLAQDLPTPLRSPSKKCYGAPDLSSPRNMQLEGKSLEDLKKLTMFPIVSSFDYNHS